MEEVGTLSGSKTCTPRDGGGAAAPAPDLEYLLTRLTTTTLVVQALLSRLAADVPEVEASVLDAAHRLQAQPTAGPREAGTRLERDVRAFFAAFAPGCGGRTEAEGARAEATEGV